MQLKNIRFLARLPLNNLCRKFKSKIQIKMVSLLLYLKLYLNQSRQNTLVSMILFKILFLKATYN